MITPKHIIATAAFSLFVTTAGGAEIYSVKALLMQALSAPDGKAHGIVAGKEADAIHSATGASDPVRAEVSTLKRFKQEGCSRLAVKLIQPNTPTKSGAKTDFSLNYELNLCRNGMPPTEGMDLGEVSKIMGGHN
ncbi:MAG: hypothetical protein WC710_05335 [Gallionella sp.]|jgi:hypothetical protein